MYTIKLTDGTILSNLEVSGNNFITKVAISEATFAGKLCRVEITSSGEDYAGMAGTFENMRLVSLKNYGEKGIYFVLAEIPKEERVFSQLRADVEYTAMMAGIELEG